jgi:chemotaxis signal transduction protein
MADQPFLLHLLIFTLQGTRFALDAEQVSAMTAPRPEEPLQRLSSGSYRLLRGGQEIPVVELAERIGLPRPAAYRAPRIVFPRAEGVQTGFLIEEPQEMAEVAVENIALLPELVRRTGAGAGVWALARWSGHLIVLIDLSEAGTGGTLPDS